MTKKTSCVLLSVSDSDTDQQLLFDSPLWDGSLLLVFNSLQFFGGQNHPAICLVVLGRDAVGHEQPVSECGDYFGNYLRRKFPKVDWHFQNVTSRFTFSTIDEDKESLLEELSVGAPPGATLQKSSLWAGTFWRVPQRHSRQRAHSYNTWPRNVETSHDFCGWNLADYANDDLIVNRWHSSSLCS